MRPKDTCMTGKSQVSSREAKNEISEAFALSSSIAPRKGHACQEQFLLIMEYSAKMHGLAWETTTNWTDQCIITPLQL